MLSFPFCPILVTTERRAREDRAMGKTRRIFVGIAAALLMALLHSSSAQAAYVCYSTDQDRWVCHATP
jgi:hypothetical protein